MPRGMSRRMILSERHDMRGLVFSLVAVAMAAVVGGSAAGTGSGYVRYHEPSQGWTANVPAGWRSVVTGPEFVRGDPLADPTRLLLRTYPNRTPGAALGQLSTGEGITTTRRDGERVVKRLHWQRYRAQEAGQAKLAVEVAVAKDGANAEVAALVARGAELGRLVQTALLPALDSFVPGAPDQPSSVLATAPPVPSYWPTAGWRTASPASQGMDGKRLDAMLAEIHSAKLPIDNVTVIRHGRIVLDSSFAPFASGKLGEPYASGRLHELQSATKSVTSMLLGIALQEKAARGMTVKTPVLQLAAAVHYVPEHTDARKRAMTIEDLLTMQSGLAWKESGYAYTPGSGNDVMRMFATKNWTKYVIDRPMAAQPGTTFVYNSGTTHLVSGAISVLTGRPAAALAAKRLFAPLGIRHSRWLAAPEGVDAGGFGLELQPRDLAKLAFLYLHHGRWDGRQVVPAAWVKQSTTDHVADPQDQYGYLWWLDRADAYAYMAGLYGQLAVVDPGNDLVAVITSHLPATVDASSVTRWLLETYILPAAR
jgi:CubicO group peptidase (beta-lactamase class C family)